MNAERRWTDHVKKQTRGNPDPDFRRWAITAAIAPFVVILILTFLIAPIFWPDVAKDLGSRLGETFIGYLIFLTCAATVWKIWRERTVAAQVEVEKPGEAASVQSSKTLGDMKSRPATLCKYGNAVIITAMAVYLFIAPVVILLFDLADPVLRGRGVPRCARRWHRALTPRYARWARERVASKRGANLPDPSVSSTEWPLFGSVFYLLATEALQADWQAHPRGPEPREYAHEAIDAAAALVADPAHAKWVRDYWGENYLHRENCFYRMLLISAAVSHANLTGRATYLPMLRDQVETLAAEIDNSPFGWIEDYPGECYPDDILVAVAAIKRADAVLGTDHSEFIQRALRGFTGTRLDIETGLPPYAGTAHIGEPLGPSRGCGNSYVAMFAPEIWPDEAREWYARYERDFWQHRRMLKGFREWPRGWEKGDWYMDVDAGPVLDGFGTAASAFGIAGARTNGRFDHAAPLAAEALVTSWPLPGGTLAGPRILSNAAEAPYLGEACILFCLSRQPAAGFPDVTGSAINGYVVIALLAYLAVAALLLIAAWLSVRRWRRNPDRPVPAEILQLAAWLVLLLSSLSLLFFGLLRPGLIILLLAQFLPLARRSAARPSDRAGMELIAKEGDSAFGKTQS
jgi:hypothetical protein